MTRNMCFSRDMSLPGREHISVGIYVSQVGECISVGIIICFPGYWQQKP